MTEIPTIKLTTKLPKLSEITSRTLRFRADGYFNVETLLGSNSRYIYLDHASGKYLLKLCGSETAKLQSHCLNHYWWFTNTDDGLFWLTRAIRIIDFNPSATTYERLLWDLLPLHPVELASELENNEILMRYIYSMGGVRYFLHSAYEGVENHEFCRNGYKTYSSIMRYQEMSRYDDS